MPMVTSIMPEKMKMLIHGDTGTGKTHLAASAVAVPEMCPVVFFDCEVGRMTLANVDGVTSKSMIIWEASTIKDWDVILDALSGEIKISRTQSVKVNTVIVDSLTELYALSMRDLLTKANRRDNPPQVQDYGMISHRMMLLLRDAQMAKVHFIATCGTAVDKDDLDGSMERSPDILGKLNYRAPRYFDIVGYLTSSISAPRGGSMQVNRSLQVQPRRRVRAKDRSYKLGISLESPSMAKIYSAIYGTRKERPALQPPETTSE